MNIKQLEIAQIINNTIQESIQTLNKSLSLVDNLTIAAQCLCSCISTGNKILICGNGGSAADAQHMAAEIVGRFEVERQALPAIALNTDSSIITAIGNDYGYEHIFSRQIQALGKESDALIAISTSGNSKNVVAAIKQALQKNMHIIVFSGNTGGICAELKDTSKNKLEFINLIVPSTNTARIQEVHSLWVHVLCKIIDMHNTPL